MKSFIIFFMILAILISAGCFVAPVDPESDPIPDPDIICEGGHYYEDFNGLCFNEGCENEICYPEGTYWYNEDGRIFLIGDTVWPEAPIDVYGLCPTEYIEEILEE